LDDGDFVLESLIRQLIRQADRFQSRPDRRAAEQGGGILLDLEVDQVRCVLLRAELPRGPGLTRLSPRELEVATMVAKGRTNRAIAKALRISLWTVDTHMRRIFAKLQVSTRAAMVATMTGGPLDQQPTGGPATLASDAHQEPEGGKAMKGLSVDMVPSMSGEPLQDLAERRANGSIGHGRDPSDRRGVAISDQAPWKLDPEGRLEDDRFRAQEMSQQPLAQSPMELAGPLVEPPPLRSDREGPSTLLRPEFEVVAFFSRELELSELEAWCAEPADFGLRLVTGPTGQGKSRLAQQLCVRLTSRGWLAGPLSHTELDAQTLRHLQVTSTPTLLVVDHAEARTDQLAILVNGLTDRQLAGTVRLLVLARTAGDWWEGLRREMGKHGSVLDGVVELELAGLHTTLNDRQRGFRDAVAAFARRRGHSAMPSIMPDLADPRYCSALNVHMAALAAVLHAEQPTGRSVGPTDPTAQVLESEQRHWSDAARASELGGIYQQVDLNRAVAAATLCGADDEAQAVALLEHIPDLPNTDQVRLARLIRWLYPSRTSYWGTLQPDLLGEELVGVVTADPDIPTGPAGLLGAMLGDASAPQAARALTIVASAAPRHLHLHKALVPLLQQDPARLLLPAAAAATQVPEPQPIAQAIRQILEGVADGPLLVELARRLPWPSFALADLTLTATQRALDYHRAPTGTSDAMTTAELLSILANRLSDVGQPGAALAAIEEAVEQYRALAEAAPDAFLPDLATSLNNLSNQLSDMGRRRTALASMEEAVAIRRKLARAAPATFLPDLALALNNLSNQLSDVGQPGAALAAIEEAVEQYRALAEAAPDAFLPDLAASLNNLATSLADMGRRKAALATAAEAVAISRRLVEARRDAFLPDLALSLSNLSQRLHDVGRQKAALAATKEALTQYRGLAEPALDALLLSLPRRSAVARRSS
jgi:DNA-binding CsgD family transcriptional regulator